MPLLISQPSTGRLRLFLPALVLSAVLTSVPLLAKAQGKEHPVANPTFYRTAQIDGLSIFYREAGPKDAPALLLLHGLPSSSRMFEPLFARLSDRYHLIAPDYPGFGHSDWPDPKKFAYTFDHIAEVMNHFTDALGLAHYALYMQDYGGPVGFRMIIARDSLRPSPCPRLEDAPYLCPERPSSNQLCPHNDNFFGSEGAAELLGLFRRRRGAAPRSV